MQNNPPFQGGDDYDNNYTLYPDVSKVANTASSYLSWASEKALENASYAKQVAVQKSTEYGIHDKVSGTATYAYASATDFTEKVKTTATENAAAL